MTSSLFTTPFVLTSYCFSKNDFEVVTFNTSSKFFPLKKIVWTFTSQPTVYFSDNEGLFCFLPSHNTLRWSQSRRGALMRAPLKRKHMLRIGRSRAPKSAFHPQSRFKKWSWAKSRLCWKRAAFSTNYRLLIRFKAAYKIRRDVFCFKTTHCTTMIVIIMFLSTSHTCD